MTQQRVVDEAFLDAWFDMDESHTRPFEFYFTDNMCENFVNTIYPCNALRIALPNAEFYLYNNTYNNITGSKAGIEILPRANQIVIEDMTFSNSKYTGVFLMFIQGRPLLNITNLSFINVDMTGSGMINSIFHLEELSQETNVNIQNLLIQDCKFSHQSVAI